MGIILTSAGLPLLTSAKMIASRAAVPQPLPRPTPDGDGVDLRDPVSSFSYRGVTIQFSTPLRYHVSANGDPVFITERASSITRIDPASTNASGLWANGAERNLGSGQPADWHEATVRQAPYGQGLEQIFDTKSNKGTIYYNHAKNVDPGATGSPIPIGPGESFSLVKQVRRAGASSGNDQPTEKYVVFTFMGEPPPGAGTWFRPPVAQPVKAWEHRLEDMAGRLPSVIQSRSLPSGVPTCAGALGSMIAGNRHTIPMGFSTGEGGRRTVIYGEDNYSAAHGPGRALDVLSLHGSTSSTQEKIDLAKHLVQRGIDLIGAKREGFPGSAGAGQNYGFHPYAYLAAFLLGDAAGLAEAVALRSNTVNQVFWVTEPFIYYPVEWDAGSVGGSYKRVGETYRSELLGMPEWTRSGWAEGKGPPINADASASLYSSYRDTYFTVALLETMAICMLRNGPNGLEGCEALAGATKPGTADYSTANIRAAAVALMDRTATWDAILAHGSSGHDAASMAVYDAWRQHVSQPRWTGRPDAHHTHDRPLFAAGGSAGQIAWDFTHGDNFATETVTRRDIGYSQDNIQFVTVPAGTALKGTLPGLRPGTQHWLRYRQVSASGAGYWSPTWPQNLPSGQAPAHYKVDRGLVTTPGSASGPVARTVPPVIHHKPARNHPMPYYEPVTDATDVVTFHAGMGYWTGGTGALSPSYQWKRNGANISGATGQSYTRTTADSGTTLTVAVTVGGVAAESAGVAIPAAVSASAGALIDTRFDGRFRYNWPTAWANIQAAASGATVEHMEEAQLAEGSSRGLILARKTAGNPQINNAVIASSPPAGTYRWETEVACGYFPASNADSPLGDLQFRLHNAAGTVLGDAAITVPKGKLPGVASGSGSFTIGSGETVRLYLRVATGVGGIAGAGGGPIITRLKIWRS